jgi:hypothetical protein
VKQLRWVGSTPTTTFVNHPVGEVAYGDVFPVSDEDAESFMDRPDIELVEDPPVRRARKAAAPDVEPVEAPVPDPAMTAEKA